MCRSKKGLEDWLDRLALPAAGRRRGLQVPWLVRESRAEPVGRALGRRNLGRRRGGRVTKEGTRTARRRMAESKFGGTLENWLEWARCGWRWRPSLPRRDMTDHGRGGDLKLEQGSDGYRMKETRFTPTWQLKDQLCDPGIPGSLSRRSGTLF
ncbi:hypothetical protein CORC01_00906 [Colletotrichum orchidophilum]|uniref:Uncharacterized protein n=1 Tax=Colletotrichum orchidophilum TaxID=1209926 RepID=A0A1G4BQM1_9PEZI|nr:uncharacterized protein CORC01_00906 [Colletotrichum orchidophilum]OHF03587.1 hypothetical protein CORC01_00906 [Colletotrichum orchidophilum]